MNENLRFEFGKNWEKFVKKHFSEEKVESSTKIILDFLKLEDLSGKYFLDIGCGSGLSSLAAYRLGASKIVSFDYDPKSVETTKRLKQMVGNPEHWQVMQGSILDNEFLSKIEPADIVYSWGVLHHTGDVWLGMENTAKLMKPDGMMYIALYEYDVHINPTPESWLQIKQEYVSGSWLTRRKLELWYIWSFMFDRDIRNLSKVHQEIHSKRVRGMDFYTDLVDWLGGWPMEFVKVEDVEKWSAKNNLSIVNLNFGQANTEYLLKKGEQSKPLTHFNISLPEKPKVCFVAPYSYPLFNTQNRTMFGGWEVRIALIAKELAKRGNFRVSIIVADHGQPHFEYREGVELISWKGKSFWEIPSIPEEGQEVENSTSEPPITSENQTTSSNTATPIAQESIETSEVVPDRGTLPKKTRAISRIKNSVKNIYKSIVPWRTRILITSVVRGLKDAKDVYVYRIRGTMDISRSAIGDIADEAVFPEMVAVFKEANADIYLVPGNNEISARVAWFTKTHKRVFIMMAGSDIDFSPDILANPDGSDMYQEPYRLKRYAIKNADVHIVQNEKQEQMASAFGRSPTLIPNPVDLDLKYPKVKDPNVILWVGNTVEKVKRPSVMLDVIWQLPNFQFIMIVTPVEQEPYDQILQASQSLPNLSLLSRIPYEEVEQYFAQAKLFVNTSTFEGFPNTFLQAGKYGVPIVSLKVDPNEMISRHGCGLLCNDRFSSLVENIQKIMTETEMYAQSSENILRYLRQYHDKDKIIPQYEMIFHSVLSKKIR